MAPPRTGPRRSPSRARKSWPPPRQNARRSTSPPSSPPAQRARPNTASPPKTTSPTRWAWPHSAPPDAGTRPRPPRPRPCHQPIRRRPPFQWPTHCPPHRAPFAGHVVTGRMAANRGVVPLADFFLAGTVVYIDHGGGLASADSPCAVNVTVGDTSNADNALARSARRPGHRPPPPLGRAIRPASVNPSMPCPSLSRRPDPYNTCVTGKNSAQPSSSNLHMFMLSEAERKHLAGSLGTLANVSDDVSRPDPCAGFG